MGKKKGRNSGNQTLVDGMDDLLLDDWFILVAAALRFLLPTRRTLLASSAFCTLTHLKSTGTRTTLKNALKRKSPPLGQEPYLWCTSSRCCPHTPSAQDGVWFFRSGQVEADHTHAHCRSHKTPPKQSKGNVLHQRCQLGRHGWKA